MFLLTVVALGSDLAQQAILLPDSMVPVLLKNAVQGYYFFLCKECQLHGQCDNLHVNEFVTADAVNTYSQARPMQALGL